MTIKVLFLLVSLGMTPCVTEDSENCYWDATTMGNGVGTSFVNVNGNWYMVD